MTKDRLAALIAAQDEDDDVFQDDVFINIEDRDGFMIEFFSEVEEIWEMVNRIQANVEEIKKKHSDILSDPQNDEKTKQKLEDLMAGIQQTASKVRFKLKVSQENIDQLKLKEKFADEDEIEQIRKNFSVNLRMHVLQHTTISKKFMEIMTDYNRTQIKYRDDCKARIQRQLEIAGKQITDEEIEEMLEQGNAAVFTQDIIMDTQKMRQSLADIEARHGDIVKLEKSIRELHDIFIDMATLIDNQGEIVDRIAYYVGEAQDCVEQAYQNVKDAKKYENKARKKKIMLAVCVAISILILICIIGGIIGVV